MATANYAAFVRLAACHQQLKSGPDPDLFAAEGVYTFYSRLYSVEEAVIHGFLPAVDALVKRYSRRYIPPDCDSNPAPNSNVARWMVRLLGRWRFWRGKPKRKIWRYETRLETNGRIGLYNDVNAAFERANRYRHQRVHWWGFPTRSGKVPDPNYVYAWVGKGLGELARADEKRLTVEFVDALPQAQNDLESIELVLKEIWEMALGELADFKNTCSEKAYRKAQKPTKKETLPSWWRPKNPPSSKAVMASGGATPWF
jgi:hypothetical protein